MDATGLSLEALRCFHALVDAGAFQGAARRLHRSQPAISQQLKKLELRVGHTLFDRKTGRPTPAGEQLYARARDLLAAADSLAREMAEFAGGALPELRVGSSDTAALYILPPCVRQFAREMPRTRLALVNRHSSALTELVRRGALDIALVARPASAPGLEARPLFDQRLVLAAPAGHRLAKRARIALDDLADEPLLLLEEGTRTGDALREHFRRAGFEPNVLLDSGSFEVIKRYVAEGVGLAFLPEIALRGDARLAAVAAPGLPEIPIGALRREAAYDSAAARCFINLVLRHAHAIENQENHG